MRTVFRRVVARVLPLSLRVWKRLPAPLTRWLEPVAAWARSALQVGRRPAWHRDAHPLVPLEPTPRPMPVRRTAGGEPLVSVIIAIHDDAPFLPTTLASVARQSVDWECVIVDDCSLDDSHAIALEFAEADPRFRVVRHDRNLGLAATRNTGIGRAAGRYLTFLDGDDFLFPDGLASRLQVLEGVEDPTVAGAWCDWVAVPESAGLAFTPPAASKDGVVDYRSGKGENQLIASSPIVRTDLVRSLGGFDERFRTAEDFEFWTRLLRNGFRLLGSGTVDVAYRQKRASMVNADPLAHAKNAAAVVSYMLEPLDPGAVCPLAVDPLIEPVPDIPGPHALTERLVTFFTFAVLTGDADQIDGLRSLIGDRNLEAVDTDGAITRAIARHALRIGGLDPDARHDIGADVRRRLTQPAMAMTTLPSHPGIIRPERVDGGPRRPSLTGRPARALGMRAFPAHSPLDVVLAAGSGAAAADLARLGRALVDEGLTVGLLADGAIARRAAHAEGIRVVAVPTGPSRLEITSDGADRGVGAPARLAIACEPVAAVRDGQIDLALVRGDWERALWPGAGQVEIGGWLSRAPRLEHLRPVDGQVARGHADTVLITGDAIRNRLLDPTLTDRWGRRLVYPPDVGAPPECTVPTGRVPLVCSQVGAVVSGGLVPADAIVFGTPVVTIGANAIDVPGVWSAAPGSVDTVLEAAERTTPASGPEDWLAVQVLAARRLLGDEGFE